MDVLTSIGIRLLIPLLFVVGLIVVVVRRGLQFKILLNDGIETTGTVVRKLTFQPRTTPRSHRIRYQYVDRFGRTHSHKSAVTEEVWRRCEEGGPFPVVYSQSKPEISAPKYLVDQARGVS